MNVQKIKFSVPERPSLMEWMLKHNVSYLTCPPTVAVDRALATEM